MGGMCSWGRIAWDTCDRCVEIDIPASLVRFSSPILLVSVCCLVLLGNSGGSSIEERAYGIFSVKYELEISEVNQVEHGRRGRWGI